MIKGIHLLDRTLSFQQVCNTQPSSLFILWRSSLSRILLGKPSWLTLQYPHHVAFANKTLAQTASLLPYESGWDKHMAAKSDPDHVNNPQRIFSNWLTERVWPTVASTTSGAPVTELAPLQWDGQKRDLGDLCVFPLGTGAQRAPHQGCPPLAEWSEIMSLPLLPPGWLRPFYYQNAPQESKLHKLSRLGTADLQNNHHQHSIFE